MPEFPDDHKRVLAATIGDIRFVCFYVPNGQSLGPTNTNTSCAGSRRQPTTFAAELERHPRLAVVGDMNIAPEDRDVHDPAALAGTGAVQRMPSARRSAAGCALGLRTLPALRAAGEDVQLVGLPPARVSEEPRPAHRPHPAVAGARRLVHVVPHRSPGAQGRKALGSRAGHRRAGRLDHALVRRRA